MSEYFGDEPEIEHARHEDEALRDDPDRKREELFQERAEFERNSFTTQITFCGVVWIVVCAISSKQNIVSHLISISIADCPEGNLIRFLNFETWSELKRLAGIEHEMDKAWKANISMGEVTPPNKAELEHFEQRGFDKPE